MKHKETNKSITKKVQTKTSEGVEGIGKMMGNFVHMFTGGLVGEKK